MKSIQGNLVPLRLKKTQSMNFLVESMALNQIKGLLYSPERLKTLLFSIFNHWRIWFHQLMVIEPWDMHPDYRPSLSQEDLTDCQVDNIDDLILVIATVPVNIEELSINIKKSHRSQSSYKEGKTSNFTKPGLRCTILSLPSGRKGRLLMLVISRKAGESLVISEDIKITITSISGDKVSIGVEAPKRSRSYVMSCWKPLRSQQSLFSGNRKYRL